MGRRLLAVIALVGFGAGDLRADPAGVNGQVLFTPAPIGAGPVTFEDQSPPKAKSTGVPAPKPRPATTRRTATAPQKQPKARAATPGLAGLTNGSALAGRKVDLSGPKAQSVDFSRGLDLGGVSLGVDTGHDGDGTGTRNLLSPEARNPPPSDPTIIKKGTPFLGLSLSAPTN